MASGRAAAVSAAVSACMSVTTTVAPSVASFAAMARPMPWPAPVTIAILPASLLPTAGSLRLCAGPAGNPAGGSQRANSLPRLAETLARQAARWQEPPRAPGRPPAGRPRPRTDCRRLGDGERERHRTAVSGGVDGPHAELDIVFGDVECDGRDVADAGGLGPVWRRGLAHHHFVASQVGLGAGVPGQGRGVDAREADRR